MILIYLHAYSPANTALRSLVLLASHKVTNIKLCCWGLEGMNKLSAVITERARKIVGHTVRMVIAPTNVPVHGMGFFKRTIITFGVLTVSLLCQERPNFPDTARIR